MKKTRLKSEYGAGELPEPCMTSVDFAQKVGMGEDDALILEFFKSLRGIGAGEIYTQIDADGQEQQGIIYSRGVRFVNRTGVYAFVFGHFSPERVGGVGV